MSRDVCGRENARAVTQEVGECHGAGVSGWRHGRPSPPTCLVRGSSTPTPPSRRRARMGVPRDSPTLRRPGSPPYPGNSAPAHGGRASPVGWRTTAQSAFTGETLHPVRRLLTMPEHTLFTAPLNRASVPKRCEAPTVLWDTVLNARAVWAEERDLPSQGSGCNARKRTSARVGGVRPEPGPARSPSAVRAARRAPPSSAHHLQQPPPPNHRHMRSPAWTFNSMSRTGSTPALVGRAATGRSVACSPGGGWSSATRATRPPRTPACTAPWKRPKPKRPGRHLSAAFRRSAPARAPRRRFSPTRPG